jgi:site-specific DNA recombinase
MPICAIVARVSTDKQGDSIEHQIALGKEFFSRKSQEEKEKWIVPDDCIYIDKAISASKVSIFERPSTIRLFEDAKKGKFNVVWFKGISRFNRDTEESLAMLSKFEALNIRVISYEENYDSINGSPFLFTIYSAAAEEESRKTGIRVSLGNKQKAKSGKWANSTPPFGYKIDKKTKKLKLGDTQEVEIIKQIFNWYVNEKIGTFKIAERLNSEKKFTRNGNRWSRKTITDILKNRAYIGDIIYGKKRYKYIKKLNDKGKQIKTIPIDEDDWAICENAHPAIIEREMFFKAQSILSSRNVGQTFKHVKYPLTGLLKCGKCGEGMVCQKRSNGKKEYRYYICKTYHKFGRAACSQANINAEKIENLIVDYLKEKIKKLNINNNNFINKIELAIQSEENIKNEINLLNKKIEKINKDTLNLIKISDQLTPEQFSYSNEQLKKELKGLIDKKQYLEEQLLEINNHNEYENIKIKINSFLNEGEFNHDLLRDYFTHLLQKVVVNGEDLKIYSII